MTYLSFLTLCMLGRLVYLFSDGPLRPSQWIGMIGVQLAGLLCFDWHWAQLYCAALLLLALLAELWLHPQNRERQAIRLGGFLWLALGGSLAFGEHGLQAAPWTQAVAGWLHSHSALAPPGVPAAHWQQLQVLLFGLLLTANEVNLAVRLAFRLFRLEPKVLEADPQTQQLKPTSQRDETEYNAGRVIGILERWTVLLIVVLSGELGVVAFVIAAKSLARFKQLDERSFAEYVLVGTLLSTFLTLAVAIALARSYFGGFA